jgi:short-subunit dehydrogenase
MTRSLDSARVWITGASSGIGAALSEELVDRNAVVAISARRQDRLDEVSRGRMAVVPLDVTDHQGVLAAAGQVRDQIGDIDVAVLNAGFWKQTDIRNWDADEFRRHVEVNLLGVNSCIAAVLPRMLERDSGTIVIVSSITGWRGIPQAEAYGSTKAALINLAESMRADLAPTGVDVQWVSPGFVKSELTEANDFSMPFLIEAEAAAKAIADGIESGRPEIAFPLPMAAGMKALDLVPHRLWTHLWKRSSSIHQR